MPGRRASKELRNVTVTARPKPAKPTGHRKPLPIPPPEPKPILLPRQDELVDSQRAFLQAFAVCGNIHHAAVIAELTRQSHYRWLAEGGEQGAYAEAFAAARDTAAEVLEYEAFRRAVEGVRRYKFYNGKPIAHPVTGEPYYEHEYSDALLVLLLRAANPQKYKDHTRVEAETTIKADVNTTVRADAASRLTPEERKGLAEWAKLPLKLRLEIERELKKVREQETPSEAGGAAAAGGITPARSDT